MTRVTDTLPPLVDSSVLTAYAGGSLPGTGGLVVERLAEGHSNLTFTVTRAGTGTAWILRRPPRGPLLPTAHDVVREATVLGLLAGAPAPGVRVPRVAVTCADPVVLGAPFYLMERVDGVVVRDRLPPVLADEAARRRTGLDLVDALAELHAVPVEPFVAAGIGRPSGYLGRQLRRWAGQREGIQAAVAATGGQARELPDYDAVRDWLTDRLPSLPPQPAAVVHGDYKLDNVILSADTGLVVAVVDWEMATVGDPLADLGYLLSFWPERGDDSVQEALGGRVVTLPGFPTRGELVDHYAGRTGRGPADLRAHLVFYETLAIWKLAVLLEASWHRHLAGTTDDPYFATLETGVPRVKALVVDYGGVLTSPLGDSMGAWVAADGVDPASFRALMREWLTAGAGVNPVHELETGAMSGEDFERALAARLRTVSGAPVSPRSR